VNAVRSPAFKLLDGITFGVGAPGDFTGAGFFIARGGWAITALHVALQFDPRSIPVFYGNRMLSARLAACAPEHDVGLLEVAGAGDLDCEHVALSSRWEPGKRMLAVGYYVPGRVGPSHVELTIDHNNALTQFHVRLPGGRTQLVSGLLLAGAVVRSRMSGGPLLDVEARKIVGCVIATDAIELGTPLPLATAQAHQREAATTYVLDSTANSYAVELGDPGLWKAEPRFLEWFENRVLGAATRPGPPPEHAADNAPGAPVHEGAAELPTLVRVPPEDGELEIAAHLVTNRQFRAFVEAVPAWRPGEVPMSEADGYLRGWTDPAGYRNDDRPVVHVSARAARAYAAWAGTVLGRPLRLPRTAEWERAAAAGSAHDWPERELDAGRVACLNRVVEPMPVGALGANPWGICDLLGNVHELCVDGDAVVARGGAWDTPAELLVSAPLRLMDRTCRRDVGFRVVHDPQERAR
jgi:hypothetical protein